jgi:hypothetical protein
MNYIWKPMSDSLGESVEIFTGAMRDHYCWIPGFWMDEKFDGDDPVVSDETRSTFNADYKTTYVRLCLRNDPRIPWQPYADPHGM